MMRMTRRIGASHVGLGIDFRHATISVSLTSARRENVNAAPCCVCSTISALVCNTLKSGRYLNLISFSPTRSVPTPFMFGFVAAGIMIGGIFRPFIQSITSQPPPRQGYPLMVMFTTVLAIRTLF